MIEIENLKVYNTARAIYSARNAWESWDKSDSDLENDVVGEKDLALMKKLYKAGPEHAKFMRQIFVSFDVTAPLYWWKEMDQYRIGVTSNSTSTMHTIHKRDLTVDDFSHEHLVKPALEILQSLLTDLNEVRCAYVNYGNWDGREDFEKQGYKKKDLWWQIIQLLPSSYNQRRTLTMSYANLSNIVNQRKNHKLDEWHIFVDYMLKNAPFLKDIMGVEG